MVLCPAGNTEGTVLKVKVRPFMPNHSLRVLLVAEHASAQFGGEAALPLHYFRILRRRGIDVWMIVHERTRMELTGLFPEAGDRIYYVPDTWWHRTAYQLGQLLPSRLEYVTLGFASRILSQWIQRRLIRQAIQAHQITLIHQPLPVSPKEPSMIFGMGVPVVIGPMNGGMEYPPAFGKMESWLTYTVIRLGRRFSALLNWVMPGKRQAAVLLVANRRTQNALPSGITGQVIELVENGVDLSIWQAAENLLDVEAGAEALRNLSSTGNFFSFVSSMVNRRNQTEQQLAATAVYSKYRRYLQSTEHLDQLAQATITWGRDQLPGLVSERTRAKLTPQGSSGARFKITPQPRLTFVYVGRLVEWKAVDCLLAAFQQVAEKLPAKLEIIGDGVMRSELEQQALDLGLLAGTPASLSSRSGQADVEFMGWLSQANCAQRLQHADVMVLPSVYECGGAVVLEAMAMGLPVIATNWGGPADYLDISCGILVNPDTRESFIQGLAIAMERLAGSPDLRYQMGQAGAARVRQIFDWDIKVDRMLEIYDRALTSHDNVLA
jgi:glycosyltransferase involved in cell wall biosynthesis